MLNLGMKLSLPCLPAPPFFGVLALLLASCSAPHVKFLDRPVHQTKTARALTNASALDQATRETLKEEQLLENGKSISSL